MCDSVNLWFATLFGVLMRCFVLLLFTFMLTLSGCADLPTAPRVYSFTPPNTPGGRLCTNQCGEAHDWCNQDCDLHQRRCVNGAQAQAIHDYDQYTRDQFMTHQPIEFRAGDFERLAPCNESKQECTNTCEEHYKTCYENCGGLVTTTTSCQYLCF